MENYIEKVYNHYICKVCNSSFTKLTDINAHLNTFKCEITFEKAINAIKKFDINTIKKYVEIKPSITHEIEAEDKQFTLLCYAIIYNDLNIAKFLIENGADINYRKEGGSSMLTTTIHFDIIPPHMTKKVKFLLDNDIDIDIVSNKGYGVFDAIDLRTKRISSGKYDTTSAYCMLEISNMIYQKKLENQQKYYQKKIIDQQKYYENLLQQKLNEQKEQLLREIYAPDSSPDNELKGIGYQAAKDRFEDNK